MQRSVMETLCRKEHDIAAVKRQIRTGLIPGENRKFAGQITGRNFRRIAEGGLNDFRWPAKSVGIGRNSPRRNTEMIGENYSIP